MTRPTGSLWRCVPGPETPRRGPPNWKRLGQMFPVTRWGSSGGVSWHIRPGARHWIDTRVQVADGFSVGHLMVVPGGSSSA